MAGKAKILLVDNDRDFLETQRSALEKHGYTVLTAESSRDGLALVRAEMPDLIVLELILERHDSGFTFTKKVKADPLFKGTPILMVTSVVERTGFDFSFEKDGYWMKTDGFLDKPIQPDQLREAIEGLLDQKGGS